MMRRENVGENFEDGQLGETWTYHEIALQCIQRGGSAISSLPGIISQIIERNLWQRVWLEPLGCILEFDTFEEFVTTKSPYGYGTTIRDLKQLCRDYPIALDWIDKACMKGAGAPVGNQNASSAETTVDNVHGCLEAERPAGNSRDAALRRLRKDRPDLHAQVLEKEMSPHAAMIEAGFRKKPSRVEQILALWKKCTPEEIEKLSGLLSSV
jgi:hypothetical protein